MLQVTQSNTMKTPLLTICAVALFFAACNETKQGITTPIAYVSINARDSTSIHDTFMKVVRYAQNGTFQNALDSVSQTYSYASAPVYKLMIRIDTTSVINYNFDMICSLYPSGKVYKITKLTHNQTSCKQSTVCKKLVTCYNDAHYYVNSNEAISAGGYGILDIEY